ncbi:hypothetical protein [Lysobacter gummosus]|uniref:hypothetical protein n=1 Tax=Lysobacter gummosus TaxID=262324 RepID=UPI00362BB2B6
MSHDGSWHLPAQPRHAPEPERGALRIASVGGRHGRRGENRFACAATPLISPPSTGISQWPSIDANRCPYSIAGCAGCACRLFC